MHYLIKSHELKNIVINYEESEVIKDILLYQNEYLRCFYSSDIDFVLVSIPNYNIRLKNDNTITRVINSTGVILVLRKLTSEKYSLIHTINSNFKKEFEFFGDIVLLSPNKDFILIANKLKEIYVYDVNTYEMLQYFTLPKDNDKVYNLIFSYKDIELKFDVIIKYEQITEVIFK